MATDVTVLGAGNTGFAVTLGELPAFPEAITPVRDSRTSELLGVAHTGAALLRHHLHPLFGHFPGQRARVDLFWKSHTSELRVLE